MESQYLNGKNCYGSIFSFRKKNITKGLRPMSPLFLWFLLLLIYLRWLRKNEPFFSRDKTKRQKNLQAHETHSSIVSVMPTSSHH